jgi:C1A family cysteine protease
MSETKEQPKGAGWIPDPLDERDKKLQLINISDGLPASVDLRAWCSPIEDQGKLNSCTAHAAITLVEYFQRRAFGKHLDASRLFLYKVTRNLLGWTGDRGANSRTTMKALALIGVPPEQYWPYDEAKLDEEPSAFCYALAARYRAIDYYRIDVQGRPRTLVLEQVKANLAANRPVMFGMIFYPNCRKQSQTTGMIPVPSDSETQSYSLEIVKKFGHNMAVVGYDDTVKITNTDPSGVETAGALLVRNSWGEAWGESGYGWLPYEYVLRQLSMDWWTMLKQEWLDTGEFEPKTT